MLRKTFGKMFTKCLEKVMCLVKKGPLARPLHYIILLQLLIYFINFSFQYATHIWMALGHQFKYDFFQWNMQISSLTQLKANRHLIKHNFSFFFNNKIFLIILFAWPFTVDIVSLPLWHETLTQFHMLGITILIPELNNESAVVSLILWHPGWTVLPCIAFHLHYS